MHRKDRKTKGGNAMIAVNSGIPSSQISSFLLQTTWRWWLYLFISSYHPVTICEVYIPPNSDSKYYHSLCLSSIGSSKNLIILGDFNAYDIRRLA